MSVAPRHEATYRKLRLIAESARARKRLSRALEPVARAEASAQRLAEGALHTLRQPMVLAAIALLLALTGPGRVLRGLRWVAFALPVSPIGRRLMPMILSRISAWLGANRSH